MILKYCLRFYDRQFISRKASNSDVLARFEQILKVYYEEEKQYSYGLPSVQYCADQLCMSRNYFSDLIKKETGETVREHIRRYIIDMAKSKLINGEQITQIAYDLGFEYPQHLSRLFKKQTGQTLSEYGKDIRERKLR